MNYTEKTSLSSGLDQQILQIINLEDLGERRAYLRKLSDATGVDLLDCAAALLFLLQNPATVQVDALAPAPAPPIRPLRQTTPQFIKMVRYRLAVGRHHRVTVDELKKILIDESGVDKNNITHVDIQDFYTLLEMPDDMPPEIFQHLKSVEINHQKLDIRKVKNRRAKKHGKPRYGRQRQPLARQHSESAGFSGKS